MTTPVLKRYLIRNTLILIFSLSGIVLSSFSQDCLTQMTINLKNNQGGFYYGETVKFISESDGKEYVQKSNKKGEAVLELPCGQSFMVTISNYTRELKLRSSEKNGSWSVQNLSYSPDMAEKDKYFKMDESEESMVDRAIARTPDTTFLRSSMMHPPVNQQYYSALTITIKDLKSGPLSGEEVTLTGINRNKSFKGKTDSYGQISFYLPKGDKYSVNFKYNKDYSFQDVRYSRGTATMRLNLMYMGTKEVERRMKEEEERIRREEERLKKEHEEFLAWCKKEKITEAEGHRRKLMGSYSTPDTVVSSVLNRNNWSEKLIVCDLTGSMNPYANQLSAWYQLNVKKEKNLQFVFFNDGDGKSDNEKKIGNTGGIYYQDAKGLDSLIMLMSKVRNNGNGGDCAENNMEALIKGVNMARNYKELVMIVDNNAPVKDIELLKEFDRPVHIVLCGVRSGFVLEDYLLIAWRNQGTIHTIEEDITRIASMSEGESIKVGGVTYKIMGGKFVRITDN